jgi:hypothetical protein
VWRIVRVTFYHLAGFQGAMDFGFANAPFIHPFDRVLSVNQLQDFAPSLSCDHSREITTAL